ncbi:hypothetical protein SAICODRAFT_74213 [Saitoella complicata NRRL Y-17804]|uniref:NADPH--cytochrome P450 reductase n=1 Tax=Saitoella complicata (strain BCRC 22490 / CBS 7301 / JCM 7358 / NBRC 10748 / NRRL Y-17804) TaxID=698492 RepID=A0A0E9NIX1_SAICN|nr:uncharacterized protein SAICODRAFT_74213 [Saitoella complicata NRRL Y-17804]ODQ56009.1 hypothetical protein SAICODRAFT_74213 [Saitoella complicata NRRL Y-17804]GAO49355.1 hypothetical protein G7K_3506-t1 [Saitoella complicata NRRL Y-17804]
MALDILDLVIVCVVGLATLAYFTKGTLWAKPKAAKTYGNGTAATPYAGGAKKAKRTRNIVEKMEQSDKNVVVFYGSQTGTAEDYASRLAKEGHARFGLKTMTADLEDYDIEYLDTFPEEKLAIFVLATYGEGEPTDNAVEFYNFVRDESSAFSEGGSADEKPLQKMKYVAFGLGNRTYEHYNAMVRQVDEALTRLGAKRIGMAGEGDDGDGTMEEDFLGWKDGMWEAVAAELGLEEHEALYEPTLQVTEQPTLSVADDTVYVGEPSKHHLGSKHVGPYNAHNPYVAAITTSKELFKTKDRNCLHMEIDLGESGLKYTTGDHIAVWPTNADQEVDRFLAVLGLTERRHTVISVTALDSTTKIPLPSPSTYDAIPRYYLEICAPVSRQFLSTLAQFAPTEQAKAALVKLGSDKEYFKSRVADRYCNIAQVMEMVARGHTWASVPFSLWIENLVHLQPRFYSISSSSLLSPRTISITAVVERKAPMSVSGPDHESMLHGVTTNYLLALKRRQHGDEQPELNGKTYAITGPRNKYDGIHVPVHTRHSNFKLPMDTSKPVIMIGPGTGVAPFRGFVAERAHQASALGKTVGKTVLFYGCRRRDEDFMYEDEWPEYQKALGDSFEMITAFSREDATKKTYVQHLLWEKAEEVDALLKQGAYLYVCGDAAHMARDVQATLVRIFEKCRGLETKKAEDLVKQMRNGAKYQEDVWS